LADKAELIITALQQRIGEIVSNYETQIAILRAEITQMMQEKEDKIDAIQKYSDSLDLPPNGETN
jgi:restriction endonuclease S subunit